MKSLDEEKYRRDRDKAAYARIAASMNLKLRRKLTREDKKYLPPSVQTGVKADNGYNPHNW